MSSSDLENKVFVHSDSSTNVQLDDNLILNTVFFQIKMQKICLNLQDYFIFVINEVSNSVRIQKLISEKKLLQQINAIVSHEMRNPLNAILAMVSKVKHVTEKIKETLVDPEIPQKSK